jgi:hypothetical protein
MSEYFVSGTEQICRTVSLVGAACRGAVLTIPKWFHVGIGKATARVRLPDSKHSQSRSLLTEQPAMGVRALL